MCSANYFDRPLVSVVLATFNEVEHIRTCMSSLLVQDTANFDLEVLAIDGGSTDGTREYLETIAAKHPHVRVIPNPRRRAPFAFNIGIRESRGQYVCIFGSHTIYARDYVSVCLQELLAKGAGGCGGRVITEPASDTLETRLVAYALAHPFGSSRKSFRTQPEGFADAVNYMVIRKNALVEIGGYSEALLRNQDNDVNQKLNANGHGLYCTWKTQCIYHPKESIRELFRYGYQNGFWNVISFKENAASMGLRHFVPFFFLAAMVAAFLSSAASLFLSAPWRSLVLVFPLLLLLHLLCGMLAAFQVAWRTKFLGALCLPLIFLGFHLAYGSGTFVALLTGARVEKSTGAMANPLHPAT